MTMVQVITSRITVSQVVFFVTTLVASCANCGTAHYGVAPYGIGGRYVMNVKYRQWRRIR